MKEYRSLIAGLVGGFVLGMLSVWTSPLLIFQRIGEGAVMLSAAGAGIWLALAVIEMGMRACGVLKDFLYFAIERRHGLKKRPSPPPPDANQIRKDLLHEWLELADAFALADSPYEKAYDTLVLRYDPDEEDDEGEDASYE